MTCFVFPSFSPSSVIGSAGKPRSDSSSSETRPCRNCFHCESSTVSKSRIHGSRSLAPEFLSSN
eukprot:6601239-Lingulodinium_polyedra.AAC.1